MRQGLVLSPAQGLDVFSVMSLAPIEHSAYFNLTSLQKVRGRAAPQSSSSSSVSALFQWYERNSRRLLFPLPSILCPSLQSAPIRNRPRGRRRRRGRLQRGRLGQQVIDHGSCPGSQMSSVGRPRFRDRRRPGRESGAGSRRGPVDSI